MVLSLSSGLPTGISLPLLRSTRLPFDPATAPGSRGSAGWSGLESLPAPPLPLPAPSCSSDPIETAPSLLRTPGRRRRAAYPAARRIPTFRSTLRCGSGPRRPRRAPAAGRRPRLGGGATGRTRACTRASPRSRPNRPALGSLSTTNSASSSATPSRSRTISFASGSDLPLASTQSTLLPRLSLSFRLRARVLLGCGRLRYVVICAASDPLLPLLELLVPLLAVARPVAGDWPCVFLGRSIRWPTRSASPGLRWSRRRCLAVGRRCRSSRCVPAPTASVVCGLAFAAPAPWPSAWAAPARSGRPPVPSCGRRRAGHRRPGRPGHHALPEQNFLGQDPDGARNDEIDVQNCGHIEVNKPEDKWHVFLQHRRLRICLCRLRIPSIQAATSAGTGGRRLPATSKQVGNGRPKASCGGRAACRQKSIPKEIKLAREQRRYRCASWTVDRGCTGDRLSPSPGPLA